MEVKTIIVTRIPDYCSDCVFYINENCVINKSLDIDECILELEVED